MKKIIALILALLMIPCIAVSAASELTGKENWKIEISTPANGATYPKAEVMIDGKTDNFFHSPIVENLPPLPYDIVITLPSVTEINGVRYTPRATGNSDAGIWTRFEAYYTSDDSDNWTKIGTFDIAKSFDPSEVAFKDKVKAKKVKLSVVRSIRNYCVVSEIDLLTDAAAKTEEPKVEEKKTEATAYAGAGEKASWKIEIKNSGYKEELPNPAAMIDGNTEKFWHSPIVDPLPPLPYEIVITLPSVSEIGGLKYTPRTTGSSNAGNWKKFEVYYSENDSDNFKKAGDYEVKDDFQVFEAAFSSKVKAKKVKVVVTAAVRNYCVVAELDLMMDAAAPKEEAKKEESTTMPASNPYIVSGGAKAGWQIEITNEAIATRYNTESVAKILDGSVDTFWHSSTEQPIPALPYEIEIIMPKAQEIGGIIYTPRPNKSSDAGIILGGDIYIAESDTANWKKVKTFEVQKSFDPVEIPFGQAFTAKKIKLVTTKTERNYCVIAELDVLSKDKVTGEKVEIVEEKKEEKKEDAAAAAGKGDKSGWKVETSHAQGSAGNIIDGDGATFWHSPITDPKTKPPFEILITLPQITDISGIIYTPRTTGSSDSGIVSKMEVYVSGEDDGEFYHINTYDMAKDRSIKTLELDANILAKRIKFVVLAGVSDYGVIAELDVRNPIEGYKELTAAEYVKQQEAMKLYEMDKTFFRAESESNWSEALSAQNVFDSSPSADAMWHYMPGTVMPVTLEVDLNGVGRIAAFKYTPRVKDTSGHWIEFNLYASEDGKNFSKVLENYKLDPASFEPVTIRFDEPVMARYFTFEILNGRGGHVACQELDFYQYKEDMESFALDNREIYTLKIGSNVLNVTHGRDVKDIELDVAPFIVSGTTMIPLRGLLEQMGASVAWDGTIDQITINKKGNAEMVMQVELETVLIGGRRYSMLIAPRIVNSRTFIPLRFVSEHLGYDVAWDGATQTITITKPL